MPFGLFRKKSKVSGLPARVSEPVDAVMKAALLLVTFEGDNELEMRQRAAACAFGAADWLCQANRIKMSELEWMTSSMALMSIYLGHGDPDFIERVGAERVGKLLGEVGAGRGTFPSCMAVGADAMRAVMIDNDKDAPLRIMECVRGS